MLVKLDTFGGMATSVAPHLLQPNIAVEAVNCDVTSGGLRAIKGPSGPLLTLAKPGTKKTLYLYEGQYWFHWVDDVDVVPNPDGSDVHKRVYYTGDGVPKMTAFDIALQGGGTAYPIASYNLGLPSPANAPIATPGTNPGGGTPDPTEMVSTAYVYCYVSAYGEIGPPSPASNIVDVAPGQMVTLSGMSGAPTGAYNIVGKIIYRTNTGSEGTDYQRVYPSAYPSGVIPVAITTVTDDCPADSLGEKIRSKEWVAPPSDLAGLIIAPAMGSLVGFSGRTVCFTPPYQPHAWPYSFRYSVDAPIVKLLAYGNSIAVLTQGMPYIMTGSDPAAMSMEKMEAGHACISAASVVDMGYYGLYASPEGLVMVGMGKYGIVTDKVLSREFWAGLNPASIRGYLWDGRYVGFFDNGTSNKGFVFDPATGSFVMLTTSATAGYTDMGRGDLYLVVNGNVVKWAAGSPLPVKWVSKPFRTAYPVNFTWLQVHADTYPATVKVYADGTLVTTEDVGSSEPVPLPAGFTAENWQIEVASAPVNTVMLATSVMELQQA